MTSSNEYLTEDGFVGGVAAREADERAACWFAFADVGIPGTCRRSFLRGGGFDCHGGTSGSSSSKISMTSSAVSPDAPARRFRVDVDCVSQLVVPDMRGWWA